MVAPARGVVVETIGLTKIFKDFWMRQRVVAVRDLTFSIRPGEIYGLLGPNGSGKTTTIKMILGLLYPTRGRVWVFGKVPTDVKVKAQIGFLPEESYLYRFLNAYETLDYYGRVFKLPRRERRRRIEMLLDMVGLSAVARRPIGEYSKGMARRIGLAQALINDPDLLILDEPTTGMDPIGSRQIKDLIVELGRRGKTILLSSHLLADVEDVCDRVAILYGGRIQAEGDIKALLAKEDLTQIVCQRLSERTVQAVQSLIERMENRRVLQVGSPSDKLESLFLRIVEEARAEQLATDGVVSGGKIAEFLAAERPQAPEGEDLIEQLVQGEAEPSEPAAVTAADSETAASGEADEPAAEVIEQLVSEAQQPERADEDTAVPAVEGTASADGTGRAEEQAAETEPAADRSVIEELLGSRPEEEKASDA